MSRGSVRTAGPAAKQRGRLVRSRAALASAGALTSIGAAAAGALLAVTAAGSQAAFAPSLDISLYDPNPSAHSSIITTVALPAGNQSLGTWSLNVPAGWSVASGTTVPLNDVSGEATMSLDVDCDGSVQDFGPIALTNQAADPSVVAQWDGQINTWWSLSVTVDSSGGQYDLSADLLGLSENHLFCGPQVFALTLFARSIPANAQILTNPNGAGSFAWTGAYVSRGAVYETNATDSTAIAVTNLPSNDSDADGVVDEIPCGSDPANANRRPERTDGAFAAADDNGNGLVDEMLPPGAEKYDCDGDGYTGVAESNVFTPLVRRDQRPCGGDSWPSDFVSGGVPNSTDRVTIGDLTSFVAPVRRLNTSNGDSGFNIRWDLSPGNGSFGKTVNINDLTAIIAGAGARPPMLGGSPAFNGPTCPWAGGPPPSSTPTPTPAPSPTPTSTPSPAPTPTPTATPTPSPAPTPTPTPGPGGDTDGDGVVDEVPCGSNPNSAASRPERLDANFAGVDDDGDQAIDEPLPNGAENYDCDGDGYSGTTENHIFAPVTRHDQDACGIDGWPSDFVSGGVPSSTNKVTITDLTSFIAPVRHLNTSPLDSGYDPRYDLVPGSGPFGKDVNISDLTAVFSGATGNPPMLSGGRALNGPSCPWPP